MTDNGTTLCFFCTTELTGDIILCRNCNRPYCVEHTSPMDRLLCTECVSFANTSVSSEPLIDSEGVTKQNARKIILSGESWIRQRKLICNMTDIELDSYISAHQEAVHEAEIIWEYRKIGLSQGQHEKAERYNKKLRARSERGKLLGAVDKAHKISGSPLKDKMEDMSKAIGALGKLGLGKAQIAAILENLNKKKPGGPKV